jgi:hypothetical protein
MARGAAFDRGPSCPSDLLGDNGYALAAPSKLAAGSYEIIHGRLDDLDRLAPMVGAPLTLAPPPPLPWSGMRQGDGRNRALWERCMRTGGGCSLDRMMKIARDTNRKFREPMMDTEVVKIADAVFLLLKLERHHGGNDSFVLSKAMAPTMRWGWDRWYAARDTLVDAGIIKCINPGGRGSNDPPIYGWALKG